MFYFRQASAQHSSVLMSTSSLCSWWSSAPFFSSSSPNNPPHFKPQWHLPPGDSQIPHFPLPSPSELLSHKGCVTQHSVLLWNYFRASKFSPQTEGNRLQTEHADVCVCVYICTRTVLHAREHTHLEKLRAHRLGLVLTFESTVLLLDFPLSKRRII